MLYVGVTSGLVKRLWQREDNAVDGLIEEVNPAWRDLYPELLWRDANGFRLDQPRC